MASWPASARSRSRTTRSQRRRLSVRDRPGTPTRPCPARRSGPGRPARRGRAATSTPAMRLNRPGRSGADHGEPVDVGARPPCDRRPSGPAPRPTGTAVHVGRRRPPPPRRWAHPLDQLGDQLGLPRAPRRRPGRQRVGLGERGQQLEHERSPDGLGDRARSWPSSDRSRRVATSGSSRWWRTMCHQHLGVVGAKPIRGPMRSTQLDRRPRCGRRGSPCRGRAAGRRSRAGRGGAPGRPSAAALAAVSHRCRSTVKRW